MKDIIFVLVNNLVAILSVIGAVFLIYHDKSGWGWLIFLAFASSATYNFKFKEKEGDDNGGEDERKNRKET